MKTSSWLVWIPATALLIALIVAVATARAGSIEIERLNRELEAARRAGGRAGSSPMEPALPATAAEGSDSARRESAGGDAERRAMQQRIHALEAELKKRDQRDETVLATLKKPLLSLGQPHAADPSDLPALKAKILDPAAPAEERIAALGALRDTDPSARTKDIIRSMTPLLDTSTDPQIRAGVCRYLHGVVDDDFKRSLLDRIRLDPAPVVREKAVECLGAMKDDPVVRQSIEQVSQTDPSDKVKSRARRTLNGER